MNADQVFTFRAVREPPRDSPRTRRWLMVVLVLLILVVVLAALA